MGYDVFISHSSKDKTAADAVCAALEANGVRCWIAPRDILPGESWASSILNGISQCRMMVLVFSDHTNGSAHIPREVERAVNRRMPIAPIRIDDAMPQHDLEYFLSSSHWMDALTPPLEKHLREFTQKVRGLLQLTGQAAGAAPDLSIAPDRSMAVADPPVPVAPAAPAPAPAAPAPAPAAPLVAGRGLPVRHHVPVRRRWVAVVAAVAIATATILWARSSKTLVPDVVGKDFLAAAAALTHAGLKVGPVTAEEGGEGPDGAIIRQSPAAGTKARTGDVVALVERKAALALVPNVVGSERSDAEKALADAGLNVGAVTYARKGEVPVGTVVDQKPPGGERVKPGDEIALVMQSPMPVAVPNVVNRSVAQAKTQLQDLGFVVEQSLERRGTALPGIVIDQSPAADTPLEPGQTVKIVAQANPDPVKMPVVAGMTFQQAKQVLDGANIPYSVNAVSHSGTRTGLVVGSSIAPNDPVMPGVRVLVSVQGATVPNLIGKTLEKANMVIEGEGFELHTTGGSPKGPKGPQTPFVKQTIYEHKIVRQTPQPGTVIVVPAEIDVVFR